MNANASKSRALIRLARPQPVRVHVDGGKVYNSPLPHFGLISDVGLLLLSGPVVDPGDARHALCILDPITRLEATGIKTEAAA